MKKLLIIFLVMMPFLFVKTNVEAEVSNFDVTFTASFDGGNIGVPMVLEDKAYGTKINFSASIEALVDYEFVYWIIDGVVREDLPYNQEFYVTGNMNIHAIFTQVDEYVVVFMEPNGKVLHITYANESGDYKIGLPSIEYPDKPNYLVNEVNPWGESYTGSVEDNTVFVLQYELDTTSSFELTVDGVVTEHVYNSVVTLTAPVKSGEYFHYWKRNGQIVSYDETIKVSVLNDTLLESVYGAAPVAKQPVIFLSDSMELRTDKNSYMSQFYLPEGYNLVETGILTVDALYAGFTMDSTFPLHNVVKRQVPSFHPNTNEFLMSITSSNAVSARAYMVYEHNNVIKTVYSSVNEPMTLVYGQPTVFGVPLYDVTVKNSQGSFINSFSIYLNGSLVTSTTNGTAKNVGDYSQNPEFVVVVVNGIPYPVEVQ